MNYTRQIIEQWKKGKKALINIDDTTINIIGRLVSDEVVCFSEIYIPQDYKSLTDFKPLCDRLLGQLNSPSNNIGKNWRILEICPDYAWIVSGFFYESASHYKTYEIRIWQHGLILSPFIYQKNGEPWKTRQESRAIAENLDDLLQSLARGMNA